MPTEEHNLVRWLSPCGLDDPGRPPNRHAAKMAMTLVITNVFASTCQKFSWSKLAGGCISLVCFVSLEPRADRPLTPKRRQAALRGTCRSAQRPTFGRSGSYQERPKADRQLLLRQSAQVLSDLGVKLTLRTSAADIECEQNFSCDTLVLKCIVPISVRATSRDRRSRRRVAFPSFHSAS